MIRPAHHPRKKDNVRSIPTTMSEIVIGIDLGGTNIKAGAVDSEGMVRGRVSLPTPGADAGPDALAEAIGAAACTATHKAGTVPSAVRGMGIGSPGTIDMEAGVVGFSPNLPQLNDYPLRRRLEQLLNVHCVLENDANAAALAESWVGAGRDVDSLVLVTLGTGIGGGIVAGGRIWHGAGCVAGEVGHMCIDPDGPPCGCGARGCWEQFGSASAMVRRMEETIESGRETVLAEADEITGRAIYEAAVAGDEAARENIRETGRYIGIGVSNLLHIINPHVVAFSGGVTAAGEMLMDPIRAEVQERAMEFNRRDVRICYSEVPREPGIVGAARCFMLTWEQARYQMR
jgi:glucokinase